MNQFFESLKGVEKVMYKTAYKFHMDYHQGATEQSAHEAGINELKRLGKLREEASKPQTYIDLSTGKKFKSTENDLMAQFA
jgi:hypothetical protein